MLSEGGKANAMAAGANALEPPGGGGMSNERDLGVVKSRFLFRPVGD